MTLRIRSKRKEHGVDFCWIAGHLLDPHAAPAAILRIRAQAVRRHEYMDSQGYILTEAPISPGCVQARRRCSKSNTSTTRKPI